jgi:hypothetical protein
MSLRRESIADRKKRRDTSMGFLTGMSMERMMVHPVNGCRGSTVSMIVME